MATDPLIALLEGAVVLGADAQAVLVRLLPLALDPAVERAADGPAEALAVHLLQVVLSRTLSRPLSQHPAAVRKRRQRAKAIAGPAPAVDVCPADLFVHGQTNEQTNPECAQAREAQPAEPLVAVLAAHAELAPVATPALAAAVRREAPDVDHAAIAARLAEQVRGNRPRNLAAYVRVAFRRQQADVQAQARAPAALPSQRGPGIAQPRLRPAVETKAEDICRPLAVTVDRRQAAGLAAGFGEVLAAIRAA